MLDVTDLKRKNSRMRIKKMEAIIDAIPDLMIEVGLDGTIYNYHSHRKDSFAEYTDQFIGKKISEILPAAAANVAFRQSGKQLKKLFGRTSIYSREE
jgi:hypothetical protein